MWVTAIVEYLPIQLFSYHQPQLHASFLDLTDPPTKTASRSNQPFFHNMPDRQNDTWKDRIVGAMEPDQTMFSRDPTPNMIICHQWPFSLTKPSLTPKLTPLQWRSPTTSGWVMERDYTSSNCWPGPAWGKGHGTYRLQHYIHPQPQGGGHKNSPERGLRSSSDLDPDLGWPWKSYRRECLIDLNKYNYLVCGCIVFHCGRMDRWTYSRMDIFTDRVY